LHKCSNGKYKILLERRRERGWNHGSIGAVKTVVLFKRVAQMGKVWSLEIKKIGKKRGVGNFAFNMAT